MADMTKSDWDQKDRRTRASIEGQVCIKELGESLRNRLWGDTDTHKEMLSRYTTTVTRILDEWDRCNEFLPLKPPDELQVPEENKRLIEQGKTLCHTLNLDWGKELKSFAAPRKASLTPYPSRILLESIIKHLQSIWKEQINRDNELKQILMPNE